MRREDEVPDRGVRRGEGKGMKGEGRKGENRMGGGREGEGRERKGNWGSPLDALSFYCRWTLRVPSLLYWGFHNWLAKCL